jgi:2',3'-cyclic-nucleotide 2'-phosphodiesterase (5'-nucleotidase family)
MKRTFYLLVISLLSSVLLLGGCKDTYKVIKSNSRNEIVQRDFSTQDSLYGLVDPYKNKLENRMSEVINESVVDMEIGVPEGILGNYISDLVLSSGRLMSSESIDFCLLNNGGLRTPILKGEVTRGMIYELMPFENELVVLTMSGEKIAELIAYIAKKTYGATNAKSGVPVSGIRIRLGDGEVTDVMIGVKQFDPMQEYRVITSDYLSQGGDDMAFFLEPLKTVSLNIKLRDVILDYIQNLASKDIKMNGALDGRIYIAE